MFFSEYIKPSKIREHQHNFSADSTTKKNIKTNIFITQSSSLFMFICQDNLLRKGKDEGALNWPLSS